MNFWYLILQIELNYYVQIYFYLNSIELQVTLFLSNDEYKVFRQRNRAISILSCINNPLF